MELSPWMTICTNSGRINDGMLQIGAQSDQPVTNPSTQRFRSQAFGMELPAVGVHFGLAPRRFQSGETDHDGRISKCGDAMMRTTLYEAAQVLLTRTQKWFWLKARGKQVARRRGGKNAIIALARR